MAVSAAAFLWTTGVLVAVLTGTSIYLRRQVVFLQRGLVKQATMIENQDARIFMLEQELRWLAARSKHPGQAVAE